MLFCQKNYINKYFNRSLRVLIIIFNDKMTAQESNRQIEFLLL